MAFNKITNITLWVKHCRNGFSAFISCTDSNNSVVCVIWRSTLRLMVQMMQLVQRLSTFLRQLLGNTAKRKIEVRLWNSLTYSKLDTINKQNECLVSHKKNLKYNNKIKDMVRLYSQDQKQFTFLYYVQLEKWKKSYSHEP